MENPNFYGIMPADVRYDKNLKPMEKILYTEITALANKEGYCYATNSYFSELYEVHKKTVGVWISNLEKNGYIKTVLIYKKGTNQIIERRIYIQQKEIKIEENSETPINENIDTYQQKDGEVSTKKGGGYQQKNGYPIHENMEDNNTRVNNNKLILKDNIKDNTYVKNEFSLACDEIKNKWVATAIDFDLSGKQLRINKERKRKLKTLLKTYKVEEVVQAIDTIYVSSFLQGKNKNNWKPTFDWMIKTNNILKVLEGNYDTELEPYKENTKNNKFTGVTEEGLKKFLGDIYDFTGI